MTTFVTWTAIDNRGITSLNFASDSRISWENHDKLEYGKKLFSSQKFPEIFGFTGDVMCCTYILNNIIQHIDDYEIMSDCISIEIKQEKIFNIFKDLINKYPKNQINNFSIFYGTKINNDLNAKFGLLKIKYIKNTTNIINNISKEVYELKNEEEFIVFDGSGNKVAEEFNNDWKKSDVGHYSRAVFSSFCEAINSNKDKQTNNVAQLISLYRGIEKPVVTGYVSNDKRIFVNGSEINPNIIKSKKIEIRNNLFERCDYEGNLLNGAQRQPKPQNSNS